MNRIVEVKLTLDRDSEAWIIEVTKEFAPENGGGSQTFRESARELHRALQIASQMVTLHPARRSA